MRWLIAAKGAFILLVLTVLVPLSVWSQENLPAPETYMIHPTKIHEIKNKIDDPRDLFVTHPLKDAIPPEIWDKIHFDREAMKKGTVEMLGFTSLDAPQVRSRCFHRLAQNHQIIYGAFTAGRLNSCSKASVQFEYVLLS